MKNRALPHMINLTLGDWSHDGHSITETITIISNLEKKDIEKAYKDGAKKTDVQFQEEVAADYEDSSITQETIDKLSRFGLNILDYCDDDDGSGQFSLYDESYVQIWLFVARVGNPDLEYKKIVHDAVPEIRIGGYGLFGT